MLDVIEVVAGGRPPTCPWRAYTEPMVGEVLRAYALAHVGEGVHHLASLTPLLLPAAVWDGVQIYDRQLGRVRAEKRANEKPPKSPHR